MSVIDDLQFETAGRALRLGDELSFEWEGVQSRVLAALEVAYRVLALLTILALLPFLVGIAGAVVLSSPGSPIFKQVRVGKDGEHFVLWKFRTMHSDAEAERHRIAHL